MPDVASFDEIAEEFAKVIDIDPWHLTIDTQIVENINFSDGKGMDEVSKSVDALIARLTQEYQSRNIEREPFAFVKSNSGTYGMGIMKVKSGCNQCPVVPLEALTLKSEYEERSRSPTSPKPLKSK